MKRDYQYLFGPVPSRRLGRSLGVDLTPFKTCTLNCVFCQLGCTTNMTTHRADYVPVAEVESELDAWTKQGGMADHITLAGSGEPSLHTRFGEVLQFARSHTAIPVALLSNGTLFWQPEVRAAARHAHIVKLSISAWNELSFGRVSRPHPDLQFKKVIDGQRAFRNEFSGKLWVEVFLIGPTNSLLHDAERIAPLVASIAPDEVHLNTAVRPPAEDFVVPVSQEELEALTAVFRPVAKVIADFTAAQSADTQASAETIWAMVRRRPCTAQQIAELFGMHPNHVAKYVGALLRAGKIRARTAGPGTFYVATELGEHVNG